MSDEKKNGIVQHNGSQRLGLGPTRPRNEGSELDEARMDLSELWEPIWRGKWIILLTCVLVVGGTVAYTTTLPEVYETRSIVSVEGRSNAPNSVVAFGGQGERELGREIGILEYSGDLRRRVATQLIQQSQTLVRQDSLDELLPIVQGDSAQPVAGAEEVAGRLAGRVGFSAEQADAGMLAISARSQSPMEAATIANVYAEEYRKFARETSRESITATRQFLEEQVAKRKKEIRDLERQWEAFSRENEVITLGQDGNRLVQQYTALDAKRRDLEFQLEREQAMLEMLQDRLETMQPQLPEQVEAEQNVASLRTQIQTLDDRIAELKAEAEPYYIRNPDLRGNESEVPELAEIQRQIEGYQKRKEELTAELIARVSSNEGAAGDGNAIGEVGALRERIEEQRLEIQQLESQIRQVESQIATYDDRLDNIPRQTINRQQLERRLDQAEDFYRTVADELRNAIVAEESELGYVKMVRSAGVPTVPVSPNFQQNLLLGILLGLGLGVGLAFVRYAMNQRLREPEDIQESGYSLVGVIPQLDREVKSSFQGKETVEVNGKNISTRLMPLHEPWSPISENYRLVRTNLQYSGNGNAPKVLLMTSPEPADGKTLTSVNVALSMAQSGRRTLLLDVDLRRPSTHKLLGYDQCPGISEVLEGKNTVDEVIIDTDLDNLRYISAGDISSPPPEALESNRMKELIDEFRAAYDVVIIDSPPVLAATDPIILAPRCDATLLVVSAEDTDLRALQTAEKTLATVGVEVAGVIFNRYDPSKDASYYAGRYRYGHYSYGYERETA
jgi:capsular exopolysaccharide synthesis family protein